MKYITELVESNSRAIADMLKNTIADGILGLDDVKDALLRETAPVPAGGDIYNLTQHSTDLLAKLQNSPDRDMLIIVKKIFRSTKYAATTWYAVTGADNNPHHLPVKPFSVSTTE